MNRKNNERLDFPEDKPVVFVTGACGMDGSYLVEKCINQGYNVIGLSVATTNRNISEDIVNGDNFRFCYCDITNQPLFSELVDRFKPETVFNMAALTSVGDSFKDSKKYELVNGHAVTKMLISLYNYSPTTKFIQASSSEVFGSHNDIIDETFKVSPITPYGVSKAIAHGSVKYYRSSGGLNCANAILFNHTSSRKKLSFLETKVVSWIKSNNLSNRTNKLELGNIDFYRNYSHSEDCVDAMILMSQQDKLEDFIICADECIQIREFIKSMFDYVGYNYKDYIVFNSKFTRASEPIYSHGDNSKIKEKLGFKFKHNIKSIIQDLFDNIEV